MHAQHEALLVAVEQVGSLTAQRLGDQEAGRGVVVERRGVELDELEVGDLGARAPRRRQTVAGRDERIGGDAEDLSGAARGENDRVGPKDLAHARLGVQHQRSHATLPGREQVDEEALLEHRHMRRGTQLRGKSALHRCAGRVAGVQHARQRMPALASERDLPIRLQIEMHPRGLQNAERLGRLSHHGAHDVLVAQPLADHERVGEVQLDAVGLPHRTRDAALCVPRVGLGEARLGDERHGASAGCGDRRDETRDAGSDHEHVALVADAVVRIEAKQVAATQFVGHHSRLREGRRAVTGCADGALAGSFRRVSQWPPSARRRAARECECPPAPVLRRFRLAGNRAPSPAW